MNHSICLIKQQNHNDIHSMVFRWKKSLLYHINTVYMIWAQSINTHNFGFLSGNLTKTGEHIRFDFDLPKQILFHVRLFIRQKDISSCEINSLMNQNYIHMTTVWLTVSQTNARVKLSQSKPNQVGMNVFNDGMWSCQ